MNTQSKKPMRTPQKKTKFSHKVMAVFLTLTFLPSLLPVNMLLASNNGPNAPEAGGFEPVDATDMVNLVTGDMSYVLPLLNVPSPEGGYPLALSYHAGIAMDQEASWVGLGWNLNPGAINRGVNGYPDDWGKTGFNEFFYDEGFEQDFYNLSVGATFKGAVSVGLGLSWGSNQSLGGYVEAGFGIKGTPLGINGSLGTKGTSSLGFSAGYGNFRASFGTRGIGLGYTKSTGTSGLGIGLNYNFNAGLSGSVYGDAATGTKYAKSLGLGVNFSSNGVSANSRANSRGAGISTATNGVSSGDYDVKITKNGFSLPLFIFYINYSHTNVKYSLFKTNNLFTSGILNPIEANSAKTYQNGGFSNLLEENSIMDVSLMQAYDDSRDVISLIEEANEIERNNLVLPNYDNYSVTAQGLSGSLRPYFYSELNLSPRGRGEDNDDNLYQTYLNHDVSQYYSAPSSGINVNRDAVKPIYFTMDNAFNSFLRVETTNFSNPGLSDNSIGQNTVLEWFNTGYTNNYSNGNSLTNTAYPRKREGNFINTFTNAEIRNGQATGLIEAKGISRLDQDTFLDDGIGAYQITTMDGKTYHYSLPVYNFETFYRNFRDGSGIPEDDKNFFELQKDTPYATHWLLTAVTGPDYVDTNSDGKVDDDDFGYWVEFDYGKWSDGYIWQTPGHGYDEIMDDDGNIAYSYSWGRKQLYYLDAIRTRTHTALFVKDIREDSKSLEKEIFENRWISGEFSTGDYFLGENYSKVFQASKEKIFAQPGEVFYTGSGNAVSLPNQLNNCDVEGYSGLKQMRQYVEIPKSSTMSLKEVILLKNDNVSFNKAAGNMTPQKSGRLAHNFSYIAVSGESYANGFPCGSYSALFENPVQVKEFDMDLHENVLDVQDIQNLNLENNALQVISFDHDYSLAQGSPNSDAVGNGRLTLNRVNFKGKKGVQLLPAYSFAYLESSYNSENEDDWGYNRFYPQAWSMYEIETPTGGKIKINYEPDSYYAEAASYENKYFENISIVQTSPQGASSGFAEYEVTINDNINVNDYFEVGKECGLSFKICPNAAYTSNTPLLVDNIIGNVVHLKANSNTEVIQQTAYKCSENGQTYAGFFDLKIKSNQHPFYTDAQANGKNGGGVRVKSVEVAGDGTSLTTEYVYTDPATNKISGITSYAPSKDETKGIPYVAELPSPMVMYGHVKMINKDAQGTYLGSTAYEFETLKPSLQQAGYIFSLGESFLVKEDQDTGYNNGKVKANKYTISSALGNLGRLKSVKTYNRFDHMLSQSISTYKVGSNLNADGEIGVTQESHKTLKQVLTKPVNSSVFDTTFYVASTSKVNYPSVLLSSSQTEGNFTNTTYYDEYDFLTGQVLETTTENSEGNQYKTKVIPAYSKYSEMGSMLDNPNNKNMLAQEAGTFTYLMDGSTEKAINANITKWKNNWTYTNENGTQTTPSSDSERIWRKHETYVWEGDLDVDGTYLSFNESNDDNFQWVVGASQTNPNWIKVSTINKYDRHSMVLETEDINGNKATSKLGEDNSKIYAVGNAGYDELFYSGAEDLNGSYFGGNVELGTASVYPTYAHTGKNSLQVTSGETAYRVTVKEGKTNKYKVSVWARKGNHNSTRVVVGNGTPIGPKTNETILAGDWAQLNFYVTVNNTQTVHVTTSGSTIYVDDFRLHPTNAAMTSYVYNEWDELTHILAANNLATQFEYDDAGRLLKTYAEVVDGPSFTGGFVPTSEYKYNYRLVGQNDDNDNGVVDGGENLDPLSIGQSVPNGYATAGYLNVIPSGGSGNYLYAFAQGEIRTTQDVSALTYGQESSNNQIYVSNIPCSPDAIGYISNAVKVRVRDTSTGETQVKVYYYQKSCSSNGGGNNNQQ